MFVGIWSGVASAIPQGGRSVSAVALWASTHPAIEPVVRLLGLHHAFASPVFLACALVLGLSTALCSWQRTKVALRRTSILRAAAWVTAETLAVDHDIEIAYESDLTHAEALSAAAEALEDLGIRTRTRDGLLTGVSAPWTVWGSPIFHWALLALMMLFVAGALVRTEGLMGLAVGETKSDAPASYGDLNSATLRSWDGVRRAVRLDAFDPTYVLGGMDRGPTPTVSLLDSEGRVVKTQRVYPNMPLRSGSLTVHNSDYGLAVRVSILSSAGAELAKRTLLVDFSETEPAGTRPVGFIPLSTTDGTQRLRVFATVPLDTYQGEQVWGLPEKPTSRVVVISEAGAPVLDRILAPGDELPLPVGTSLRLDGIGWYSRLSIVDDWTIPFIYAAMLLAIVGLTISLVARQQLVLVGIVDGSEGTKLVVKLRLWRNVSVGVNEVRAGLNERLRIDVKKELQ